jgi:tetratricopeptide (TPR) repeat protein
MRPTAPLEGRSPIGRLLLAAPPGEVEAEIVRLAASPLDPLESAALQFARGSLALRRGELAAARDALGRAVEAFSAAGSAQAARLAECDLHVAASRASPRSALAPIIERLRAIEAEAGDNRLVRAVAMTVRASVHTRSAEPDHALRTYVEALACTEGLARERAHALSGLGTLYVALGVHGAAAHALEHALELGRRSGDVVTEAIAHGQLGALALARGDLDAARRHFGAQELLADRLGDAFGRARALAYLAEVALEASQPEAALGVAEQGMRLAASVTPPLAFGSYAERIALRAAHALGQPYDVERARTLLARFEAQGGALGAALTALDMARTGAPDAAALRDRALRAFASLGLTGRIAEALINDHGAHHATVDVLVQPYAHLADAHEVELVYTAPEVLSWLGGRRIAAQRALAKLAVLEVTRSALVVAACIGEGSAPALPGQAAGVCAQALGCTAVFVWPASVDDATVEAEVSSLAGVRAAATRPAGGYLAEVPFAGEPGARLREVDVDAIASCARGAAPGRVLWLAAAEPKDEP